MPVVKQYIKSLLDIPVVSDAEPDESIALGVGMAAGIKERTGDMKDVILSDICPFSLGTEIYDGSFSPIIERNDTLPCSRTRCYVTVSDFQTELDFNIYQGESLVAKDNLLIGQMKLKHLPKARAGEVGASVTFLYDINGILDIRITSGEQSEHKVILNKNMGLSESEVEKRVKELQKQTLYPVGQEKNRLLIERAGRIYMESDLRTREIIAKMLRDFKEAIASRSSNVIREHYVRLSLCLSAVENRKFQFEEFDENFYHEDEEKDS